MSEHFPGLDHDGSHAHGAHYSGRAQVEYRSEGHQENQEPLQKHNICQVVTLSAEKLIRNVLFLMFFFSSQFSNTKKYLMSFLGSQTIFYYFFIYYLSQLPSGYNVPIYSNHLLMYLPIWLHAHTHILFKKNRHACIYVILFRFHSSIIC